MCRTETPDTKPSPDDPQVTSWSVASSMNKICVEVIIHYICHKLIAFREFRNYIISPIGFLVV